MRKKFVPSYRCLCASFVFLLATTINYSVHAQDFVFAKSMGNPFPLGGNIIARATAKDASGNVYITGYFTANADFDPGPGTSYLGSAGSNDIFLAKYDVSGNYVYAKRMGGSSTEIGYGMTLDASGNIYITGIFSGTADFDPGAGIASLTSSGSGDFFIAKYDASGNYVFAKKIGGTGDDVSYAIALDALDNIYITGYFNATVDFDPGAGTVNLVSAGGQDIFLAKYDASGNYIYARAMGGVSNDVGYALAVDASNNVFLTGSFNGSADFDPAAGIVNLNSSGSTDIFLARYDASGNYVYANSIGGSSGDVGYGIALDASGNAYITGNFSNTVDFDPGAGTINLTTVGTSIFIAKYNASGSYVYANAMSGSSTSIGYAIDLDASNNAYFTGYFSGTVDFDGGAGTANLTATGSVDIFIAKYDASGNYLYAKAMGGTLGDVAYALFVDASANVTLAGSFQGTADLDPGAGTASFSIPGSSTNAFILMLNTTGDYLWAGQLGNLSNTQINEQGRATAVDASGNVYVAGSFSGTVDLDPGAGSALLTSTGGTEIFVAKYDASGEFIYAKAMGGTNNEEVFGIAVDGSGTIYITGYFNGIADFDPGAGIANLTSAGSDDIFIACYDASGNYVYAKQIGGISSDKGYAIAVNNSGNVFIAGDFNGTVDFDPGAGTANITSAGGRDIFIARYDASGNYVYAKSMGGISSESAYALAVDASNNIYITGFFQNSADFDPGAGTVTIVPAGGLDVFLAKYDAAGNYVYAKALGGSFEDYGLGVAVDASNNAYVTGYFTATADFDPGAGTANLTSAGSIDVFLARYDASGNYVYAKRMGGTAVDAAYGIALDAANNAYITGYFQGTGDFDPGAGTVNLTSTGSTDVFLAKYDASGNYVYANAMGSTGADYGLGVAVDNASNAFITGYFVGTADFDPSPGVYNISATNSEDIFLAKYGLLSVLPVKLEHFSARVANQPLQVILEWSTSSQMNHDYFDVERSNNGIEFKKLGQVNGCTNCVSVEQYSFNDGQPFSGRSFYRLKMTDKEGKIEYSAIRPVEILPYADLLVYPAIGNGSYQLSFTNSSRSKNVIVNITDGGGKLVVRKNIPVVQGVNSLPINITNQASGVYYIHLMDETGLLAGRAKLIKN